MNRIVEWIATVSYTGYSPVAPGTAGSFAAALFYLLVPGLSGPVLLPVVIVLTGIGIWTSHRAEKLYGHDASRIVIDEFAGVFVCFLGLPVHWFTMIPVFVLFRIIDVAKPPPCRRLEKLPSGWGVTADDIGAGIYTNIVVRILVFVWPGWFGWP